MAAQKPAAAEHADASARPLLIHIGLTAAVRVFLMSDGNGWRLKKARCPICENVKLTRGPTVFLGDATDVASGRKLAVEPRVCENCGNPTLWLAPGQPATQRDTEAS
jgi:hypothetical protein